MKPKIVAVIQARMNSSRLYGKTLLNIEGQPLLMRVVGRVCQAKMLDDVIVATSLSEADLDIKGLCKRIGCYCFRGSEPDVLDRIYRASKTRRVDVVVRITADCALVDPWLIDEIVCSFLRHYPNVDYCSNILPRTYPRGLDVEVINFATLEKEWRDSVDWREHVTMNLRQNYWNYVTYNVSSDRNYSYMRWVVDTADDLELIRKIYRHLDGMLFGWRDVIALVESKPELIMLDTQNDPK